MGGEREWLVRRMVMRRCKGRERGGGGARVEWERGGRGGAGEGWGRGG